MAGKPDEIPNLGIDTTPRGPVNLQPGRRKVSRRPSEVGAFARWVGGLIGVAFLGLVVEGLSGVGSRAVREAMKSPEQRDSEARRAYAEALRELARLTTPTPDAVDVAKREGLDARADSEEEREERLRAASRLVTAEGYQVDRAEELAGGQKIAFLAHLGQGGRGSVYSCVVERGVLTQKFGPEWFEWETMSPEALAAHWADRYRGDGPYRAKVTARTDWPASLEATVTHRATGRRERLSFSHFNPTGTADIVMTPLD